VARRDGRKRYVSFFNRLVLRVCVIPGRAQREPGISRFRVRCFASPRNDGVCFVAPRDGASATYHSSIGWSFDCVSFRGARLRVNPESRDSGFDASHRPGMTECVSWPVAMAGSATYHSSIGWSFECVSFRGARSANPESRDSGFDASHRPGMTECVSWPLTMAASVTYHSSIS
jgi:hypothetical protein